MTTEPDFELLSEIAADTLHEIEQKLSGTRYDSSWVGRPGPVIVEEYGACELCDGYGSGSEKLERYCI
jgi:hypothetical protein